MIAGIKWLGAHLQAFAPRQRDSLCPPQARCVPRRQRLTASNLAPVGPIETQFAAVGLHERGGLGSGPPTRPRALGRGDRVEHVDY